MMATLPFNELIESSWIALIDRTYIFGSQIGLKPNSKTIAPELPYLLFSHTM